MQLVSVRAESRIRKNIISHISKTRANWEKQMPFRTQRPRYTPETVLPYMPKKFCWPVIAKML